ncbi:MAG: hypothetical protein EP330_04845 [Deltaproteobacteria bacterium]|nr:MAG: hypothetical protein EP330_04845 [Deltaproteobacteria bacterium]
MTHPAPMPHDTLQPLAEDVWWMRGSVRMAPGMVINRVMVVLRHEGELTVINAVRPEDPGMLDALGKVANVVKIGSHGMDDPWFLEHYGARRWAAEGLRADVVLGPETEQPVPWMQTFAFQHTVGKELALLLDRGDGILVTCDAVQHWDELAHCSFIARAATRFMGFNARPAQIGPPWRKQMTPKGGSLEPDFRRLLELEFDTVVGGHGEPLVGGAREALRATVDATF